MKTIPTLLFTASIVSMGAYASEITETPHTQQLAKKLTDEKHILVDCYVKDGITECALHLKDGLTYIHPDS